MKRVLWLVIIVLVAVAVYIVLAKPAESPVVMETNYQGGVYTDYEGQIPSEGDTILFFHADRCSTCNLAERNFQAAGIPEGLTILKVNYDEAEDLKEQYNILTQTSYVYVEPDGTLIKRRVGGTTIDDILEQVADAKSGELKPREKVAQQGSDERRKAYFAGGCFRCLEGPFESLNGVEEVISGYIGGEESEADYDTVAGGQTDHRESVEVIYDPALISYADLVNTYWRQIDPTDAGGQFADRGYEYTTAIYYSDTEEQDIAESSKQTLEDSGKFDEPIAVQIAPKSPFYPAEDYHQDYYKKNSAHYNLYKKGSGRAGFIEDTWEEETLFVPPELTEEQREIIFEEGTEKPFDNAYWDNKDPGIYVDILDGTPLFSSTDKFDSGTGWPSFSKPIDKGKIDLEVDNRYGMQRIEVETDSDTHLGHIFDDGPGGTQRYCINSAALKFIPLEEMEALGYSEWLGLFEE